MAEKIVLTFECFYHQTIFFFFFFEFPDFDNYVDCNLVLQYHPIMKLRNIYTKQYRQYLSDAQTSKLCLSFHIKQKCNKPGRFI
jgi:hypothetical protein